MGRFGGEPAPGADWSCLGSSPGSSQARPQSRNLVVHRGHDPRLALDFSEGVAGARLAHLRCCLIAQPPPDARVHQPRWHRLDRGRLGMRRPDADPAIPADEALELRQPIGHTCDDVERDLAGGARQVRGKARCAAPCPSWNSGPPRLGGSIRGSGGPALSRRAPGSGLATINVVNCDPGPGNLQLAWEAAAPDRPTHARARASGREPEHDQSGKPVAIVFLDVSACRIDRPPRPSLPFEPRSACG